MSNYNLDQLYRAVIMDHYKNPRNKGLSKDEGYKTFHLSNPSCGDDITVQIKHNNKVIEDVRHEGTGCSICCSSASVMSEVMKNKEVNFAKELLDDFLNLVMGKDPKNPDALEEAIAYGGVSMFPARVKCATLAWKALEEAINEVSKNEG